jgi:hypothetical protein
MPMMDLDIDLSDEERRIRDLVHKFAAEVMRPAGIALDRLPDHAGTARAAAVHHL